MFLGLDILQESSYGNTMLVEGFGKEYEPGMEGMMEIMLENAQDAHDLDMAVTLTSVKKSQLLMEGKSYEAEMLQENVFKNVFAKMKELFKKMWARMKDFFKSVRLYFDKWALNSKKFVEKYKDLINEAGKCTVEGYDYNVDGITVSGAWGKMKSHLDKLKGEIARGTSDKASLDVSEVKNDISKEIVGKESSEFKKGVQAKLGITPVKKTISYDASKIISILSSGMEPANEIKKDEQSIDSAYSAAIKEVEAAEKASNENAKAFGDKQKEAPENAKEGWKNLKATSSARATDYNRLLDAYKQSLDMINSITGLRTSALKAQLKQAQSAAYAGIAKYRKETKKERLGESTGVAGIYGDLIG